MPSYPFRSHDTGDSDQRRRGDPSLGSEDPDAVDYLLSGDESLVELRCSVIVARRGEVLLLHRERGGAQEWVLPGGRPRPGEGMLACARREVAEETGLVVSPDRCAFIADVIAPDGGRRRAELVFVARPTSRHEEALVGEEGAEPVWVPVERVRQLDMRPPIAGFLPAVALGRAPTAPYLGNLWRSEGAL